jgi:hypothetical protein
MVPCGPGGVVHDYIPFYLCKRSSMLLSVVKSKNVDQQLLIYFALPISLIERPDVVFTDASANTELPPNFFSEASHLSDLNWSAINSQKWVLDSDDEKQSRMAEVLIHRTVDIQLIDHIIVWNNNIKMKVEQIYRQAGLEGPPVKVNSSYFYFTTWWINPTESLTTGPYFTRRAFEECVQRISEIGQDPGARFAGTSELIDALRVNLANLPETAELVGLETDNKEHTEDVGDHTVSVVRELTDSDEYDALSEGDKRTVELAAFLHDIGKGPKARWASTGGKQLVDANHPIKSVKMLIRILTEEVREVDPDEARTLAKLICYHDLVGDILAKDRNPEQLEEIAESARDLEMLIALGLADMRAINAHWYNDNVDKVPELRDRVLNKLNSGSV